MRLAEAHGAVFYERLTPPAARQLRNPNGAYRSRGLASSS